MTLPISPLPPPGKGPRSFPSFELARFPLSLNVSIDIGMTTREQLNRNQRRGFLLIIPGFVLFAAGMAAAQTNRAFIFLGLLGFAMFVGSAFISCLADGAFTVGDYSAGCLRRP